MKNVDFKVRLKQAMDAKDMKAVDLCNKTGIPKGAISYYLNGRSEPKADRLFIIAKVLDVSEAWLLGYDVQMERTSVQKNNDTIAGIVVRMRTDEAFFAAVQALYNIDPEKINTATETLKAFAK